MVYPRGAGRLHRATIASCISRPPAAHWPVMPEEKPSLHIDDDWKKQAQEEKRRLAEQQQKAAAAPPAPPRVPPGGMAVGPTAAVPGDPRAPSPVPGAAAAPAGSARTGARGARQMPEASFATLVQGILTQALFYLGELSPYSGEPVLNLDMARHQVDQLAVLEQKTVNNLTEDEKRLLDAALYDARTRFVSVASQFINP